MGRHLAALKTDCLAIRSHQGRSSCSQILRTDVNARVQQAVSPIESCMFGSLHSVVTLAPWLALCQLTPLGLLLPKPGPTEDVQRKASSSLSRPLSISASPLPPQGKIRTYQTFRLERARGGHVVSCRGFGTRLELCLHLSSCCSLVDGTSPLPAAALTGTGGSTWETWWVVFPSVEGSLPVLVLQLLSGASFLLQKHDPPVPSPLGSCPSSSRLLSDQGFLLPHCR